MLQLEEGRRRLPEGTLTLGSKKWECGVVEPGLGEACSFKWAASHMRDLACSDSDAAWVRLRDKVTSSRPTTVLKSIMFTQQASFKIWLLPQLGRCLAYKLITSCSIGPEGSLPDLVNDTPQLSQWVCRECGEEQSREGSRTSSIRPRRPSTDKVDYDIAKIQQEDLVYE